MPSTSVLYVEPVLWSSTDGPIDVNYRVGHDYTGGTPMNAFNRNSNSPLTPNVQINMSPTGTTTGIINSSNLVGNTGGLFTSGGGQGGGGPLFIGPSSVVFLIEFVNNSGGTVTMEYDAKWYEVPNA